MKKFISICCLLLTPRAFAQVAQIRQEAENKGIALTDAESAILTKAEQIEAKFSTLQPYSKEYDLKTLACQMDSNDFNAFVNNLNILNDMYTNDISVAAQSSIDYLKDTWGLTDADKDDLANQYLNQLNKAQLPVVYISDDKYDAKCNLQEVLGIYIANGKLYKTAIDDLFPTSVKQTGNEVFLNLALASIYNRIASTGSESSIDSQSLNDNADFSACKKSAWSNFISNYVASKGATIGVGTFSYACSGCADLSMWKVEDKLEGKNLSDSILQCANPFIINDLWHNYIINEFAFIDKIKDLDTLKSINNNVITENELTFFYNISNTTNNEFNSFVSSQNNILIQINKRHNNSIISQDELITEITPIINQIVDTSTAKLTCKQRWILQLAANTSLAIGATFACGGADLTVVGGIICHAAVVAGLAAANAIAWDDYQSCLKNVKID